MTALPPAKLARFCDEIVGTFVIKQGLPEAERTFAEALHAPVAFNDSELVAFALLPFLFMSGVCFKEPADAQTVRRGLLEAMRRARSTGDDCHQIEAALAEYEPLMADALLSNEARSSDAAAARFARRACARVTGQETQDISTLFLVWSHSTATLGAWGYGRQLLRLMELLDQLDVAAWVDAVRSGKGGAALPEADSDHKGVEYEAEFAKLSAMQLASLASEPRGRFPPEFWAALEAENMRRKVPTAAEEVLRRQAMPDDGTLDISSWLAISTLVREGASADEVHSAIAQAIGSDPFFRSLSQPGYPLDVLVRFDLATGDGSSALQQHEMMWVRLLCPAHQPNHWFGRLLNKPALLSVPGMGDYVEIKGTPHGLVFLKLVADVEA